MRNIYVCFTALFLFLGFQYSFGQRPGSFQGSLRSAEAPSRNTSAARTVGAAVSPQNPAVLPAPRRAGLAAQLHAGPGFHSGNPASRTATCGPDTVYYPLAKATGFQIVDLNDSVNLGQWYPAPQPLDITGISFFGFVDSSTSQTVTLQVRVYNAAPDSTPQGAPLATATITIDSNFYNGNLALLEKHVSFSSAVTVTNPYVVTVENNNSSIPAGVVINDLSAIPPDGANEWLACVHLPAPTSGWLNSRGIVLGTVPLNADALIHPHVSYELTAAFQPTPPTACSGITQTFLNTSSPINLSRFYNQFTFLGFPERSFIWSWGDGSPDDTTINGIHTYGSVGTFNMILRDTVFGWTSICVDSTAQTVNVGTGSAVVGAFTYSASGQVVSFTDQSANSPVFWGWDFGDGNTSTSQNPTHTYSANGIYTVCMVVGNQCGADTICQQVLVGPPPPSSCDTIGNIVGTPTLFGNPTVGFVSGHNVFQDSAKAEYFANSTAFSFEEALYWFALIRSSTPTTSQVIATVWDATGPAGAPGNVIRTQPLTYNNIDTTGALTSVTFTPPIVTSNDFYVGIQLEFNSGDTVALVNNANGQTIPATAWEKDSSGTWQRYDASTSWGLDVSHAIWVVQRVAAGFTFSTAGLNASFTDASEGAIAWLWDFGDGSTSTLQNPGHTYAMAGTYTVCQLAFNGTCIDTICQSVTVTSTGCPGPTASFTFTGNPTVSFTNTSTTTGSNVTYFWDFGDGNTSTQQNPTHTYVNPNTYNACLIVTDSCGMDTTCQSVTTTVGGCPNPVANFSFSGGPTVTFVNTSSTTGSSVITGWDFGDGTTSTQFSPTHTYATPGNYLVCLAVLDSCGADSICQTINVACPTPTSNFTFTTNNLSAQFTDASSGGSSWSWDFGDGTTSTLQNPTHTYSTPGTYNVCLTVTNSCGSNTFCQPVSALCPIPTAGFTFSANSLTISFSDQSTNSPVTWVWDFGDGNSSLQQNPTHTYALPGTYTVCLLTINSCGSDTICFPVAVSCPAPAAGFTFLTVGNNIDFTNTTSGGATSYIWDFGDGSSSAAMNPSHSYSSTGTFNVCLVASSVCGADTFCQDVIITCVPPTAAYSFSVTDSIATFVNNSSSNSLAYTWTFGDGSFSTAVNPSHTYQAAGTYQVCLVVSNTCGLDTICQNVTITCTNPTAGYTVSLSNSSATFTDVSLLPQSWSWDFGDGNTSTLQNPSHVYSAPGTYRVCLTVTNFCGTNTTCQNLIIACNDPQPNFSYVNGVGTVNFTDLSTNNPNRWRWDFGDGTTDTVQNPQHGYLYPGSFYACLRVWNDCGRSDTCMWVTVTTIGVEDGLFGSSLVIYPNPGNGLFQVEGDVPVTTDLSFSVSNALGKRIWTEDMDNAYGLIRKTIDLQNFSKGVYFLEINGGDKKIVRKIVIE